MLWQVIFVAAISIVLIVVGLYLWWRSLIRNTSNMRLRVKHEPTLGEVKNDTTTATNLHTNIEPQSKSSDNREPVDQKPEEKTSPYAQNTIIFQLRANPDRPYFGYELLQTLYSSNFCFGDKNIFHRHERIDGTGAVLFSAAAATSSGSFPIDNMGAFYCAGLVMFMKLSKKNKLMANFDLMLDTARQITEDLGGSIYDEMDRVVDAAVIKELRERICSLDSKSFYTSDLLDNL